MTFMKKVSVILPNYNYARFLKERVRGILGQSYPVHELIILDDASNDGSEETIMEIRRELADRYPDTEVYTVFNKNNSGNPFLQWEKGIKMASGDYIWIAEADDLAKPDFLKTVMRGFKDSETVLSYCNSKYIDENGKVVLKDTLRKMKDKFRRGHFKASYIVDGKAELNRNLAIYNSIPNVSAVVFKNSPELSKILERAEKYQLAGDWYFYIELAQRGKIAYSARSLNLHRIHKTSVTNATSKREWMQEMQKIHAHAKEKVELPAKTLEKMERMEKKFSKKEENAKDL